MLFQVEGRFFSLINLLIKLNLYEDFFEREIFILIIYFYGIVKESI